MIRRSGDGRPAALPAPPEVGDHWSLTRPQQSPS